jgi:pyroglutamyl-peptidase
MVQVLLTGFGPFADEPENPSSRVAELAAEELRRRGYEAASATLPVSFRRCGAEIRRLLEELRPRVCVALGLSGGISHVRVERVAVNMKDARRPDNDGEQPVDEPIDPGGPAAYFSTLPTRLILEKLREEGIPAALSYSAGTFLCNFAMYTLLRHSELKGYPARAGFLHLPYTPEIAARKPGPPPSLPLDLQVKAAVIAAILSLEKA